MTVENIPYRHRFRSIAELHREADLNFAEDGGLAPLQRFDIVESDAEQFEEGPASIANGRRTAELIVIGLSVLFLLLSIVAALMEGVDG